MLAAFQMVSYKLLRHQDGFHPPISLPFVILMCVFFFISPLPLSKSHIPAFFLNILHLCTFSSQYATVAFVSLLKPLSTNMILHNVIFVLTLIYMTKMYKNTIQDNTTATYQCLFLSLWPGRQQVWCLG